MKSPVLGIDDAVVLKAKAGTALQNMDTNAAVATANDERRGFLFMEHPFDRMYFCMLIFKQYTRARPTETGPYD